MRWRFSISGLPVAQPRTKAVSFGGHARVYTPKQADVWKLAIVEAAKAAGVRVDREDPVSLDITFYFPRPKGHYGVRMHLKASAPRFHMKKPDVDNLAKAVMDALVRGAVLPDDDQVIYLEVKKTWCEYDEAEKVMQDPGCEVVLATGQHAI